jgi:hypothetical protein
MRCPVCKNRLSGCGIKQISNHTTKATRDYEYYRCNRTFISHTCTFRKRPSQLVVEKFLIDHVLEKYERLYLTGSQKETVRRKPKRNQLEKLETQLNNLNYMFRKDRITLEEYDSAYEELQAKISECKKEPKKVPAAPRPGIALDADILELYQTFTREEKRDFWQSLIKEIYIDMDGHPTGFDFL